MCSWKQAQIRCHPVGGGAGGGFQGVQIPSPISAKSYFRNNIKTANFWEPQAPRLPAYKRSTLPLSESLMVDPPFRNEGVCPWELSWYVYPLYYGRPRVNISC